MPHAEPPDPRFAAQIVAGVIEERGIERFLGHKYPLASSAASFVARAPTAWALRLRCCGWKQTRASWCRPAAPAQVRTGNTFVGSLLWVDFVRLLGMQKLKEPAAPAGGKGAKGPKAGAKAAEKKPAAKAAPIKAAAKKAVAAKTKDKK